MNRRCFFCCLFFVPVVVLVASCRLLASVESLDVEKAFEDALKNNETVETSLVSSLLENRRSMFKNYLEDKVFVGDEHIYLTEASDDSILDMRKDILRTIGSFVFQLDEFETINRIKYPKYDSYANALLRAISSADTQLLQRLFNSVYYPIIIDNVLESTNLYGQDTFRSCYSFIRRMGDLILDEQKAAFPKASLNFALSRIFPCSRRLMRAICLEELIRKRYYSALSKECFLGACVVDGVESELKLLSVEIQADKQQKRHFSFEKKGPGINPGFVIRSDGLPCIYVKMFHLADSKKRLPTKGELNSQRTRTHVTLSWRNFVQASQSLEGSSNVPVAEFQLDLREPFLYMVLERLGVGPKFEVVINPFVYQGMYMATDDAAENGKVYYSFSQIQEHVLSDPSFENYLRSNNSVILALTELEIVSRLLGLRDLHAENFGFVSEASTLNEIGIKDLDLKVVDFVYPGAMFSTSDLIDDLKKKKSNGLILMDRDGKPTLVGRLVGNEDMMKLAFRRLKEGKTLNADSFERLLKEVRALLFKKLLTVRGNDEDEQELKDSNGYPRTNAELIGFKLDKEKKEEYILGQVVNDLDGYIEQLVSGFRKLEEEFRE